MAATAFEENPRRTGMVFLREADDGDLDLLYEWANDAEVRKNSFHTDQISYAEHVRWFREMMRSDHVKQFILMDQERPVGQIRVELRGSEAQISYSVAAAERGRGYGRVLLERLAGKIQMDFPQIHTLTARVRPENEASRSVFEREGYVMAYLCYKREMDAAANRKEEKR